MGLFSFAGWISEIFNNLWLLICDGIYIFINALYQVYEKVASVNLFSKEIFEDITGRMYIIMGIAMLFVFAYNIILLIINPDDKKGTSGMTKIIKETIISLVLVVLMPLIFNYLFVFQTHVLESNIIGNIILGDSGSTSDKDDGCAADDYDCRCDFENYKIDSYNNPSGLKKWAKNSGDTPATILGDLCNDYKKKTGSQRGAYAIAPTIFSAFYNPTNFDINECANFLRGNETVIQDETDKKICVNYFFDVNASKYSGNITPFFKDKYIKDIVNDDKKDNMEFHWLMAIIAGCLAVWMFLCYSMEIGVRVAKLGFLQLVSPIPVMMRIIPGQKEKLYKKWFDNLVKTYLDVFIRVIIIDFSLFGISLVPTVLNTMWTSSTTGDGNWFIKALATVFVILGILKFAQDSPNLIKEFFGDAGTFKLRSPRNQIEENKLGSKALGAVTGAGAFAAGASRNFAKTFKENESAPLAKRLGKATMSGTGGLFSGAYHGITNGLKNGVFHTKNNIDDALDTVEYNRGKHKATRDNGATLKGRDVAWPFRGVVGAGKNIKSSLETALSNAGDYFTGGVASAGVGEAANNVVVNCDKMENTFDNANIKGIKDGRQKWKEAFESDQPFKFGGKTYNKSDNNHWTDEDGNTYESAVLKKSINEEFKRRIAAAYGEAAEKGGYREGFERLSQELMKSLRTELPKFGESFSDSLFNKLNEADGLNLNVSNMDQLQKRMDSLLEVKGKSSDQIKEDRAVIYSISDEIKGLAKGVKTSNSIEQSIKKDNKAKKDDKK